jgi:tripartite-type tricarboxylate transporter receptor subunit TctC
LIRKWCSLSSLGTIEVPQNIWERAVKIYRPQLSKFAHAALFVVFVTLFSDIASSQTTRTIKIIVPAPPGGVTDVVARLLGDQIGRANTQTLLIESRAGAGGLIATEAVSRAAPDGNTLLIMITDLLVLPHLRKLNYDMLTGFEPICELVSAPLVIAVNRASAYRTLADLIGAARARPGELTLAAFGPATAFQMAIERLKRAANINMIFLPYPGGAPVVNALLGDHVTAGLTTYSTVSEYLNAGTMRALATTSRTRLEPLPEVPTIAEAGYKDSEMDWWIGMLAPAKTPKEKLSQLADWFTSALRTSELWAKLAPLGVYPVGICGADFAALIRKQYNDFGSIIRDSNIKAE